MAGAQRCGDGGGWSPGHSAVGALPSECAFPRHPDAGKFRTGGGASRERLLPRRVCDRLRPVCRGRLRARCRRLCAEAVQCRAPASRLSPRAGTTECQTAGPRRTTAANRRDRVDEADLPAMDQRRDGRQRAAGHRRRDLLLPGRHQVHKCGHRRLRGADPDTTEGAKRSSRSRQYSGRFIVRRSSMSTPSRRWRTRCTADLSCVSRRGRSRCR